MIIVYNYSVTGDCSNTGNGAVYFDITGTTPTVAPFSVTDATGQNLLPLSAATTSYFVTGLTGGTYYATIADSSTDKIVQNIYISTGTTATIDSTPTTCGFVNGSITGYTSAVYGISSFILYNGSNNYITSASTTNNYGIFPSLSAGTYYIVANDGGGCTGITSSVIITPSSGFTYGAYIVNDASCLGTGSGKIFLTGLTPPTSAYTVNWSPNANGQTGTTITGLTGDIYTATVTDPNSCVVSQSFTVTTVPALTSGGFITITQPSCFANDGEVEFVVVGGTAPYFFSASTGQVEITFNTSATFTGLSSGFYTFIVTDAGLCTITDSVSMLTPNSFTTVQITTTNSFCSSNDGTLNVLVDGGVSPAANLLISISGTTGISQIGTLGNANQTFFGLGTGDYLVTVVSAGCTYTATTSINSSSLYSATTQVTGTTCGLDNGSLLVTTTGGTLPFTYSLTGPTYSPITVNQAFGQFTNLQYGNYTLTIQDNSTPGCVQNYPIYVGISQSVDFNLYPVQPFNGNDGSITALITQGTPPFTLSWTGGTLSGQTGTTVTGLTAGVYDCTVTDANNCVKTKSIKLTGTKKYNQYKYYNVCHDTFRDTGLIQKKSIRNMFIEGFDDLTSGDTNCIINNAIFTVKGEVGGQTAYTQFYTSSGSTDYPSDIQWADGIVETLEKFVGIGTVVVDFNSNRITITTDCEEITKNCGNETINPLQDTVVKVDLLIDYNISCVSCT